MRIAVVGAGIAGLGAARALARAHHVEVFERDARAGGHANTVALARPGRGDLHLDTGFLVHNRHNYPRLTRLFRELGVRVQDSDMSFSVSCARSGLEYSAVRLWSQPRRAGASRLPRAAARDRALPAHGRRRPGRALRAHDAGRVRGRAGLLARLPRPVPGALHLGPLVDRPGADAGLPGVVRGALLPEPRPAGLPPPPVAHRDGGQPPLRGRDHRAPGSAPAPGHPGHRDPPRRRRRRPAHGRRHGATLRRGGHRLPRPPGARHARRRGRARARGAGRLPHHRQQRRPAHRRAPAAAPPLGAGVLELPHRRRRGGADAAHRDLLPQQAPGAGRARALLRDAQPRRRPSRRSA